MNYAKASLLVLASVFVLAGCAGTHQQSAGHLMTDPKSVQVYSEAPQGQFEDLGPVQTPMQLEYGENFSVDQTVESLREQAAALGANGILLQVTGDDKHIIMLGGYWQDRFVRIPVRSAATTSASAEAIFLHP